MARRRKKRKKKRKKKRASPRPDDYFAAGPFEFAQFGKVVVSRSRLNTEQSEAMRAEMVARFPTIVAEIDLLVAEIANRVARLPPDQLLHRAWWELASIVIGLNRKNVGEFEQLAAMRMIDYVQSIIAAVKPNKPYENQVSEEDWTRLKKDIQALFTILSLDYQWCLTAYSRAQDPCMDMELEEFRFRAEVLWMNVRGQRYQPHERQALIDVLTPHSDVLIRLFGFDTPTLVGELDKILGKLTRGLGESFADLEQLRDDTLERIAQLADETPTNDLDALSKKMFENDPDLAARRDRIAGEVLGLDLFDVQKITQLPKAFLDELTWLPGEDKEFFTSGEFCGWPLRVWPTMKRPFIRLGAHVLCFDMFALFDNFYRVLQRVIFRLAPDYRETWNIRQKAVSESLPFTYFDRILSGARVFRSVYYRWRVGKGRSEWHEADGLIIYDDHLFVIEVKAGAFTYTSPATDLPAHIASLKNLVRSPASQGSRFVDYLESATEVSIFDAKHNEIGHLRRADFRNVTIAVITLDPFTELAARAQHLRKVGIDVGERSVWVLSIDDLRVYADLFENALVFLHFVEQRMRAACSEFVNLDDEMDHLGLYVAENNYSQYAERLIDNQTSKLQFTGYKTPIDEYYSAIVRGDLARPPTQSMPDRFAEIIEFLAMCDIRGRSELASLLLDAAGDLRETIAASIDQQLRENIELRRVRPVSIFGDVRLTLYSWSPAAPRQAPDALNHTRTVIAAHDETTRLLLELEYTSEGQLKGIHWQRVGLMGLSGAAVARLRAAGAALLQRRVLAVQKKRKIGPNEVCPCGSGRKYKRCCRP